LAVSDPALPVLRQMRDNLVGAQGAGLRRERQALSAAILALERRQRPAFPMINLVAVPGPFALGVVKRPGLALACVSVDLVAGHYLIAVDVGKDSVTMTAIEEPLG
jgi:hypothetical protein